jgi:hypothetical protein
MKTLVVLLAAIGFAVTSTSAFAEDCEDGMTWDEVAEACVPSES